MGSIEKLVLKTKMGSAREVHHVVDVRDIFGRVQTWCPGSMLVWARTPM